MCRDNDHQLYNDLRIFKVVFCIYLLVHVLPELNILNKIFQIENVDLSQLGVQIELTTRSLTRMFLDAENFGVESKYVKIFMDVAQDGTIEYRDKIGIVHTHALLFQEIPNCGDSGGSFHACKELAQEYVQAIIDALHVRFPDMQVFNATKIFSPISYPMELPLLYRNAQLWLQILLNHFSVEGSGLVNRDGCIFELKSFVDTLQVAYAGLKVHHAWSIFAFTDDYLSRFPHMIQLWQVVLTLPASTATCEREFPTQNHIKSFGRCALNISTLEVLMRIIMAKIPIESLDFEDIWERWMSVKDRRFQESL